jgi:hypothetical protein
MTAKDVLANLLKGNLGMTQRFLGDLSDADLLVRPVPGANHIAWQLGHLISAEAGAFQPKIPGAKPVELPAGFAAAHSKEMAGADTPGAFRTKAEYLALAETVRGATLAALDGLSDADLDKDSGMNWDMVPTVGSIFALIANHELMHAGQFTVVRRKLGKPVLF